MRRSYYGVFTIVDEAEINYLDAFVSCVYKISYDMGTRRTSMYSLLSSLVTLTNVAIRNVLKKKKRCGYENQ